MNDIKEMFHSWLKKWGGAMAEHEEEVCKDITDSMADHVGSAINRMEIDHLCVCSECKERTMYCYSPHKKRPICHRCRERQ